MYNRNIPSDSLTGEVGSMLNTTSVATHKNFFVPGVEDIVITVQAERLNTNVDGCLGEKCRKTIETVIEASDEANTKLITSKGSGLLPSWRRASCPTFLCPTGWLLPA